MNARELHMSRHDQDATVEATPPPPEPEPASKGGRSNAMAARLAAFQQPASDGGGPKPFTGGAAAPRAQTLPAKCGLAAKFESQAAVGPEAPKLDGAASRTRSFGSGGGGIAARAAGLQFNPAMLSPGGAPKSPMPKASSAPDVEDGVGKSQGAVAAEAPKPDGFAPRTPTLPAKCGLAAKFESQAAVGPEAPKLDGAASRTRSFGSGGGGIAARAAGLQFNPAMLSPGGMPKPRQSSSASASECEEGSGGGGGGGGGDDDSHPARRVATFPFGAAGVPATGMPLPRVNSVNVGGVNVGGVNVGGVNVGGAGLSPGGASPSGAIGAAGVHARAVMGALPSPSSGIAARAAGLQFNPAMLSSQGMPPRPRPPAPSGTHASEGASGAAAVEEAPSGGATILSADAALTRARPAARGRRKPTKQISATAAAAAADEDEDEDDTRASATSTASAPPSASGGVPGAVSGRLGLGSPSLSSNPSSNLSPNGRGGPLKVAAGMGHLGDRDAAAADDDDDDAATTTPNTAPLRVGLLEVSGVGITGQPSWAPFKCELTRDALCLYTAIGRPELVGSIPFADYEASRLPSNPDVAGCVLLQPASAGPLSRHGKAWVRVPSAFDPSTAVRAKEMDAWKAAIDAARAAMHAAAEEATHALLKASVGESTYQQAVEESRRARDSARASSGRLSGGAQDDAEDDGGLADLNRTLSLTLTQVMASDDLPDDL